MSKDMEAEASVVTKFYKEQLVRSNRYFKRRDLLGALLTDNKAYSLREVDTLIDSYLKGKVK